MSDLLPWMAPWSGRLLTLLAVVLGLGLIVASWRDRHRVLWCMVGLIVMCSVPGYVWYRRVQDYGWKYPLRIEPLYSWFGRWESARERHGDFVVTWTEDARRPGEVASVRVEPGGEALDGAPHIYAWRVHCGDVDVNGDGREDLVLVRHVGGNTDVYRVYELIEGRATLLREASGSSIRLEDSDADGVYEFVFVPSGGPIDGPAVREALPRGAGASSTARP